jgi:hypothetical protein
MFNRAAILIPNTHQSKRNKNAATTRALADKRQQRAEKPPAFSANIVLGRTFRFRATSAATIQLVQSDFCAMLACVNFTGAVPTATSAFSAVRIRRVQMWSTNTTGADATVSWTWAASSTAVAKERSDTSVSVSVPSYVTTKPPHNHPSSFWLSPTSTAVVAYVKVPTTGAIIDIDVTGVLMDGVSPFNGNTGAPFTGIVGVLYGMPLDNNSNLPGSRTIIPVGLQVFGN